MQSEDISLSYDEETRVLTIKAVKGEHFKGYNRADRYNNGSEANFDVESYSTKHKERESTEVPDKDRIKTSVEFPVEPVEPNDFLANILTHHERETIRQALIKLGRLNHGSAFARRSLALPHDAELENMRAWYKDGLLVITMPRNARQWNHKDHPCHIKTVPVTEGNNLTT